MNIPTEVKVTISHPILNMELKMCCDLNTDEYVVTADKIAKVVQSNLVTLSNVIHRIVEDKNDLTEKILEE